MLTKEEVAKMLLEVDAVGISPTRPFKYSSGLLSPIYTNCRILSSHPTQRDAIIKDITDKISVWKDKLDVVVGTGTSSIFLASLISQRLKLPMAYVRAHPKTHGKRREIEGAFKKGDQCLLISDIISTEQDIPISVKTIRKHGGDILHCLALFSNNIGKIESVLKNEGISYSYLTDITTLLKVASKEGMLSQEEIAGIEEWAQNPEQWHKRRSARITDLLEDNRKRVAKVLLEIGAVSINLELPFKYASGILSPIYIDNRLLVSYPDKWPYVIDSFLDVIENVVGLRNFHIIAGTATSGIPHATLIADRLGLPMIYVRFERNEEGEHSRIEGKVRRGDRVVMIEDHITTGKSVLSSIRVLRQLGAIVEWCIAIFTYDMAKSKATFAKENINLVTLCDLSVLMDIAIKLKYIKPADKEVIGEWVKNPKSWIRRRKNNANKSNETTTT